METAGGVGNKLWLLGWYVDKDNTMLILLKEENDKILVKQQVGGATAKKQSVPFTLNPNVAYAIRMVFDGTNFELFVDNVSVMIFTPVGAVPTGTVGFQVKGTTGSFDWIHVN
jgi:hypothetical protein